MSSATVTATSPGFVPFPEGMPDGVRLERASWVCRGIRHHVAGPGFWHLRQEMGFLLAAAVMPGDEVTLYWED